MNVSGLLYDFDLYLVGRVSWFCIWFAICLLVFDLVVVYLGDLLVFWFVGFV